MADTTNHAKSQQQPPRGIAAAAIEGAKAGDRSINPDDASASLARPAPGMTSQPEPAPSSTNQYTGITGGLHEQHGDDDDVDSDGPAERGRGGDPDTDSDDHRR